MLQEKFPFYTYKKNRKCLHCGALIADQKHASSFFCPRKELPDHTIQSCKDDYHFLKNKEKNALFLKIATFHKDAHKRIEKLLSDKGETVTAEQVNQYGVRLDNKAMPLLLYSR